MLGTGLTEADFAIMAGAYGNRLTKAEQQEVIYSRYILCYSLAETASKMGLSSREKVRWIEAKALRNIARMFRLEHGI